jgi:Viral BACON domain/Putative binding domain, N-terminal
MGGMPHRLHGLVTALAAAGALSLLACNHRPTEPTPICTITLDPTTRTFPSDGGSGSISVAASAASCAWTTETDASWVTIVSGATGTGSGTVRYTVAGNPSVDVRTASLAVGGQVHGITQEGRPPSVCTYTITPSSGSAPSDGGTGSFTVNAAAECPWTALASESWLVVTSGASGSGGGTVEYRVARNDSTDDRVATVDVAGQRFTLTQSGQPAVMCTYSVAPVQFTPCMPSGSATTRITTQPSCPWTAVSSVSWLAVTTGSSGTGSADISAQYSANYDAPREGLVMLRWPTPTAGQNVRITQAGCYYGVSRSAFTFGAAGGSGTFDVVQQSDPILCGGPRQDACVWSAVADVPWITITTSMPRTGDDPVAFVVAANMSGSGRTGTITVRDKTVQIAQAGQ